MAPHRFHPRFVYGPLVVAGGLGLLAVVVAKWFMPDASLKASLVASVAVLGVGLVGQLQRPVRAKVSGATAALRRVVPGPGAP